jgi:tetratricopeptide (TPR) repeat protein
VSLQTPTFDAVDLYASRERTERIPQRDRVSTAYELDPLNLLTYTVVGDTLFYARRFDRSVAAYRKCLELDSTFGAAHTDLARSLEQVGRADEAVEEFVRGTAGPDGLPRPCPASRSSMRGPGGGMMRAPP